jgi:hypothetical protein
MASEKDLELLDQYVGNRLTAPDRAAFEKKLASDTSLQNEFNLQQRVVEKIREARIREIKTMFNSVPASALEPSGTSLVTQVTLGVAIVGAIGAGIYFYVSNEDKAAEQSVAKQEEVTSQLPQVVEPQEAETSTQESPATGGPESLETKSIVPPVENKKNDAELPGASSDDKAKEEAKGPAPLDVFDPSEETESQAATPEAKRSESSPLTKSSIVVETDNSNKKYNFHYQFKNGKLYLYGTFEKNLYEIMEFFSGNKRTVFLYYKDSYYLLNEENETIKPLAPINDPSLLKKLKDYRGAR